MTLCSSISASVLLLVTTWAGMDTGSARARLQEPGKVAGEYEVYAAVLADGRLNGRDFRGHTLVLRERSVDPRKLHWWNPAPGYVPSFDLARRVPEADASTISNFTSANDSPISFAGLSFHQDLAVSVLADKDYERLFISRPLPGVDVWKPFYDAFPQATGVIQLSRAGFSSDGRQALVYIGRQSHLLAGEGSMVLLRRDEKGWRIGRIERIWVS